MFSKIKLQLLIVLGLNLTSCNKASEEKKSEPVKDTTVVEKKAEEAWVVFALKKNAYESELKLRKKGSNQVEFELSVSNKQTKCTGSLNGIADTKDGDSETDEDPITHEAYPVTEYLFTKDGQFLSIRIDDTWSKVNIKEADKTKELHGESCPLGDVGILTKK